ncbi:hypothetical protein COO60DRAFT_1627488 [Scenedesmus sp. NREL 46B-D3]|nr:hypothetical protein COO60DRAFT_1627488 [Scenedesmus sp. NREL 46B-D3]
MRKTLAAVLRGSSSQQDLLPVHYLDTDSQGKPVTGDSAHRASPLGSAADAAGVQQLAWHMLWGLGALLAPLVPVAVLCLGIFVTSVEAGDGKAIDRESCTCDCWDGRFKGRHGVGASHAGYKSVYFNLEAATVLLCAWTFVWVNALGVSMQRILLLFTAARLSYRALVPALLSFYPFFYGAWATWNYVNDRFYIMLPSQLFFQLSELVPAYLIYQLLDRSALKDLQPVGPVLGLAVSCVHISLALKERVLWGLFLPGIHTVNVRMSCWWPVMRAAWCFLGSCCISSS